MRQIGLLKHEPEARRFTAYLVTEGIVAHFEPEGDAWAIWVRDENDVDQARDAMDDFRRNPESSAYQGVEREANSILRREAQQRQDANRNVVDVRKRWARPGAVSARRAPLVFVLIGLSVVATIWTNQGRNKSTNELSFVNRAALTRDAMAENPAKAVFSSISQGQLWRLVTPIFVHLNILHLVFNMYWVYFFGSQIENRRGTWFLGLQVLLLAVITNVAQALIESPFGFGMSGVVYGLFGYVWMKSRFDPAAGMMVTPTTVVVLIGWFFLCLTGLMGPIANTAHGAGLVAGILLGFAPVAWRSLMRR